jgi:hypothetical protein
MQDEEDEDEDEKEKVFKIPQIPRAAVSVPFLHLRVRTS